MREVAERVLALGAIVHAHDCGERDEEQRNTRFQRSVTAVNDDGIPDGKREQAKAADCPAGHFEWRVRLINRSARKARRENNTLRAQRSLR